YRDRIVLLEFDEFDWAGADRAAAHVARRHMAGVDRRPAGRQKREQRRLRPLQMEGDLVIAVGGQRLEVRVPGFSGIETELLARCAGQQVPGTLDVLAGEGLAIMPFDALAQWEGQLGPVLVPRPPGGEVGDDRLQAGLR